MNLQLTSLDAIQEVETEWLVKDLLPRGTINIMAGDGGVGKGFAWCKLIACITSGSDDFLRFKINENYKNSNVVFFSSEDSVSHILKKRLRENGADFSKIFTCDLSNPEFSKIKFDSTELRDLVRSYKPVLVVLDPIQSFFSNGANLTKRTEVREQLNCILQLAEEVGTTFLLIMHTNKSQNTFARSRLADSADLWDIARTVSIVGVTKEGSRYFSQEKNNYASLARTVLFRIDDGIVKFEKNTDLKDRDFVLRSTFTVQDKSPQRSAAESFVLEFLEDGEKHRVEDLQEQSKECGITYNALKNAKASLKKAKLIEIFSEGYGQFKKFYIKKCIY